MKLLLMLLTAIACSEAARILSFLPLPFKSHHYFLRSILAALGEKGHEVVYVTGYPYEGDVPPGIVQKDISGFIPDMIGDLDLVAIGEDTILGTLLYSFRVGEDMAHHYLGNPVVQELIHSHQKFDAVILESYILQECLSGFVHKFGAVGIDVLPGGDDGWANELSGLPDNPSWQVDYKVELTPKMNFWQRLYNSYIFLVTTFGGYYYMSRMQNVMDQYFNYTGWESRPPIGRLLSNRSLILTNFHPIVGYPAPLAPHRRDVGGAHIRPNKPLPEKIQTFMDESKHGVIYLSFGSNIRVSDPSLGYIRDVFMKVFEELPQRVLMKWETEYPGKLPKNVLLDKWFPQQDILAHKNCVLFITHGGYLSLTEAVHFGVPVIGIPFFSDQAKNFIFVEDAGIGKMLRLRNITYESASSAVREILSYNKYKEEMMRRSTIFRDRRSPTEEAVYWVEHAIKYPNSLTPKATSLSFFELHLIDIKFFIFSILSVIVYVLWKLLAAISKLFRSKPKKVKMS